MSRKVLAEAGPSFVLAVGIIISTIIAVTGSGSWWPLAVLLLVLSMLSADVLATRLQGGSRGLSAGMLIVSVSVLLGSALVATWNPALVDQFIPIVGAGAAAVLLLRTRRAARDCGLT